MVNGNVKKTISGLMNVFISARRIATPIAVRKVLTFTPSKK